MGSLEQDPLAPVILGVTGIAFVAVIGWSLARRFGQPAVLGQLLIGVAVGQLGYLAGIDLLVVLREGPAVFELLNVALSDDSVRAAANSEFGARAPELLAILQGPQGGPLLMVAHVVDVFSRFGVIFLLFLVGLDNTVDDMMSVGAASARVATIGVVLPFVLVLVTAEVVAPGLSGTTTLFVAATFVATSVGITAAVLEELQADRTAEGRTVLGAAVFDDVFGLLVLAVVSGIVLSGGVALNDIVVTIALAVTFLLGALWLGRYVIRASIYLLRRFDHVEAKIFTVFLFVMILSWTASLAGLASIIGAFAAGLILHEEYFADLRGAGRRFTIKELVRPIEVVLAPIFFVTIGVQVKLESFLSSEVLWLAIALALAAVIGKLASGWGASRGSRRWMVGLGMVPRGEVGLIFASIGKGLDVLSDAVFAAVVLAVVLTTVLAPPLMRGAARGP